MKLADICLARRLVTACACLFTVLTSTMACADDAVVGWIANPDFDAFTISRQNAAVPKGTRELQACDIVKLVNPSVTVHIVLSSYQRIDLDASVPERQLQIPCEAKGNWQGSTLAIVQKITAHATAPARHTEVITATRGELLPAPLTIPALGNYNPRLAAGNRSLYVAWTGGVAPYSVTVSRYGGGVVTGRTGITSTSVSLPSAHLAPGRYVLLVEGSDGHGLKEDGVTVIDPSQLPPPPAALRVGGLTQADRQLLYAYYLEGLGEGEWTFEALQQAASIDPPTAASSDWVFRRFSQTVSTAR